MRFHVAVCHKSRMAFFEIVPFVNASEAMSRVSTQQIAKTVPHVNLSRAALSKYIKCGSAGRFKADASIAK